jgi:hypothetical protein
VKYFVQLTGLVFENMGDREVKNNARNFICALSEGLSDKVEANRKEISAAINKIGGIYSREQLLTILGTYLDSDKESRIEIMNLILENSEFIEKADIREYPKGIIRGLTDKNKEIRSLAEKLLERVYEKLGLEVFKTLAKNERPAITKDLNSLLAKYEGVKGAMVSKGPSPPKNKEMARGLQSAISAKKIPPRSDSKTKAFSQVFEVGGDNEEGGNTQLQPPVRKEFYSTFQPTSTLPAQGRSLMEGNEDFAPLKILTSERVQRQEKDERYPWSCDNVMEAQSDELRESL